MSDDDYSQFAMMAWIVETLDARIDEELDARRGWIDMTKVDDLHERWMTEPAYQRAHAATEREFTLARELIAARVRAGLTQEQLAQRMGTTQSAIARLESGQRMPGVRTLERLAEATGTRLVVRFERTDETAT